jgi:adenylosuccinate lyase
MLDRSRTLVDGLVVYEQRLRENLDRSGGLWASEGVLLELVGKGLGRQDAYVLVQRNAMRSFEGQGAFQALLEADPEVRRHLDAEAIARQFDLGHALAHVDTILDRVFAGETGRAR